MKELAVLMCAILQTVVSGFFLSIVWKWFAVPFGAPVLSIAHAIGFQIVAAFLLPRNTDDKRGAAEILITAFVRGGVLFLCACVTYWLL